MVVIWDAIPPLLWRDCNVWKMQVSDEIGVFIYAGVISHVPLLWCYIVI